ncbi:MAG: translation elongation factor Ts [Planctomycetes bacterium]|jgi:elongation factor Ts|nr:translation elongation factor Ts [Planctomycetota bacterium]
MEITAALVKDLREKTGCPMMDCKKALQETGGDLEAAIDVLRKRGIEGASNRKDRATSEGFLAGALDPKGHKGVLVELLCESDFVARNEGFRKLAAELANALLASPRGFSGTEEFQNWTIPGRGTTPQQLVLALQTTLKENMKIGRVAYLDGGTNGAVEVYVHFNGKNGAVVHLELGATALEGKPAVKELLRDLCMQVVSAKPVAVSRDGIPAELVERERAVIAEMDEVKAKPEKVRPKIIEGKLGRFYAESALLEQEFVKEKKVLVRDVVKRVGAEAGGSLTLKAFHRIEVGKD